MQEFFCPAPSKAQRSLTSRAGKRRGASYLSADDGSRSSEGAAMTYILAVFLPPLGLLLNGQPFSAIFNLVLIPSLHAVIAVHMRREDRKHRELVDAIEKHGPPPWWLR